MKIISIVTLKVVKLFVVVFTVFITMNQLDLIIKLDVLWMKKFGVFRIFLTVFIQFKVGCGT